MVRMVMVGLVQRVGLTGQSGAPGYMMAAARRGHGHHDALLLEVHA